MDNTQTKSPGPEMNQGSNPSSATTVKPLIRLPPESLSNSLTQPKQSALSTAVTNFGQSNGIVDHVLKTTPWAPGQGFNNTTPWPRAPAIGTTLGSKNYKLSFGQPPFASWSNRSRLLPPECSQFSTAFSQHDDHQNLLQNPAFMSVLKDKIANDEGFIRTLANKIKHKDAQGDAPSSPLSHLSEEYLASIQSLSRLCEANGLPGPSTQSVFITDESGIGAFQATVKVGHKAKHIFTSQKREILEDAISEAYTQAVQALEDLGLTMNQRTEEDHTKGAIITKLENNKAGSKSETVEPSAHRNRQVSKHSHYSGVFGHIAMREEASSSPPNSDTSEHFLAHTRVEQMSKQKRKIRAHQCLALKQPQTPSVVDDRKRKTYTAEISRTPPPKLNMINLMAHVYAIPRANPEARVSGICNYLGVDKPVLEVVQLKHQPPQWRVRFNVAQFGKLSVEGPTKVSAFRQAEHIVMQKLGGLDLELFIKSANSSKRRKIDSESTTRGNNEGMETLMGSDELFIIDPTGDEGLRLAGS